MAFRMNGAHSLLATLTANGIGVCFANPGTSEMHFVAALVPGGWHALRAGTFRGRRHRGCRRFCAYGGPASATLLHLGPGLANGLANLHNATKASTPIVNIVGDHATYHRRFDAPLTSDIDHRCQAVFPLGAHIP